MNDLETLRKYAVLLGKASRWINSGDPVINIDNSKSEVKKSECVFEFYCALRILYDLSNNYRIEIVNNKIKNIFPKSPSEKRNFPYFIAYDKVTKDALFQICLGTKIIGKSDEKNAPDISIQKPTASLNPDFNDVEMIYDAKFKHKLNASVTDGEFAKVYFMIVNLGCEGASHNILNINYHLMPNFIGNCLISNGKEYKRNKKLHDMCFLKEIVKFGESTSYEVYG